MNKNIIAIDKKGYEDFIKEYGISNLKTRNGKGEEIAISELEKNALECVFNAGMFIPKSEKYIIDEKMYALYFAIHQFMETGSHLDAFDLYCIYSGAFLDDDGDQLHNMMNFVASYENGAARLVQSHRDHYVHSAYVFILGLAMFHTKKSYREAFSSIYSESSKNERECYSKFVDLWGLTALFHDIGYQYEIPFNQIRENNKFDYITDIEMIKTVPAEKRSVYFQYKNMDKFTDLLNIVQVYGQSLKNEMRYTEKYLEKYLEQLVDDTFKPCDIEEVFAYHIKRRLSERAHLDIEKIAEQLRKKNEPEEFLDKKANAYSVFMDHAYYSGIRLFKQMIDIYGLKFCTNKKRLAERMDAITAIVMHNKFFELCLSNEKNMSMQEHPLAYLLILCDELQCWNRTSYGKSSLTQFHAKDCIFDFSDGVSANYIFDVKNDAIKFKNGKISTVVAGPLDKFLKNKDKEYVDGQNPEATKGWDFKDCTTWEISSTNYIKNDDTKFLYSIHDIVDCTGNDDRGIGIQVGAKFSADNNTYCREYLTTLGMEDLYKLAELCYENDNKSNEKQQYKPFYSSDRLIQDKLHEIMMARKLGKILNEIGCFATKEQKAFERIMSMDDFTDEEMKKMCDVMLVCQKSYATKNSYIFGKEVMEIDFEEFSERQLKYLLEALFDYPGIEVYKI